MTAWTFEGWNIKSWVKYNKESIKATIVFVAGYNYVAGFTWASFLIGIGALCAKLVIDTVDYYVSE